MVAVPPANLITLPEACGVHGLEESRYNGILAKLFWDVACSGLCGNHVREKNAHKKCNITCYSALGKQTSTPPNHVGLFPQFL